MKELIIPPEVQDNPDAFELLRLWTDTNNLHISLQPDTLEDPAGWGIILIDIMKHLADGYNHINGADTLTTLNRIKEGFDAEWKSPTDTPTGYLAE